MHLSCVSQILMETDRVDAKDILILVQDSQMCSAGSIQVDALSLDIQVKFNDAHSDA